MTVVDVGGHELGTVEGATEREARDGARAVARAAGAATSEGPLRVIGPVRDGVAREVVTVLHAVGDSRPLPPTRQECIAAAGAALAEACRERATLPAAEAARRAYTPTGPPFEELERRIAALRGQPWPPDDRQAS